MMYLVTFFNNGAPVCHWHGFATYGDARRALADADASIPLHWDWAIHGAEDDPAPARIRLTTDWGWSGQSV